MRKYLLAGVAAAALASMLAAPNQATAAPVPVGLELSLLVDSSGSISSSEYALQMNGYAAAFESAGVQNAISGNPTGSIAVQMIQWSSSNQQSEVIGWTQVSAATADTFAATIRGIARAFGGGTSPQAAMSFASTVLANEFDAPRQVMDVSGDGAGERNTTGRDAALAAGYDTINGLVVSSSTSVFDYYEDYIMAGQGSFVKAVATFDDFGPAIQEKLLAEIVIPIPGAAWLFGTDLVALFGFTRRRMSANA